MISFSLRTIATSHFEPTDARYAFPCLDEPNFKARFHLTINHDAAYTALSNMPVQETRDLGHGRVQDTFKPSVRMSTYLVAFAIVDFKYKEKVTKSGIKVKKVDIMLVCDYPVSCVSIRKMTFFIESQLKQRI